MACTAKEIKLGAQAFINKNPELAVPSFKLRGSDVVTIKEHAPHVFRQIRRQIVSEKQMLDSFNPANNIQAIHDLDVGQGKSPSFFFFTDDFCCSLP